MEDRTERMTDDPAVDHRTQEIRAEIEQTRDDMSETIDAIQEKLRPGRIVAEATSSVTDATREKVRDMAYRASDAADRQTWIPAAMIGIGTAWLLMNRSRSRSDEEYETGPNAWRETGYAGDTESARVVGTRGEDTSAGVRSAVSGMAGQVAERAGEVADNARQTVRQTSRRAQNQLQRAIRENPLAVGAAAAILGAAVGLALPETERENEWMGETRDNVLDKAQDLAREAKDKVKNAASDAVANTLTGSTNE